MRARLVAGALVLAGVGWLWLVPALGSFLVVADPLPPTADAIVVLAGSVRDRTLEAATLYRQGLAPRVVVTREALPPGDVALRKAGVALPDSDALARTALEGLGVPASAIVTLRRRAPSTAGEARTIARWACTTGVHQLVVVTSPSHTRRARLILRRALGPRVAVSVQPSTTDTFAGPRWYRVRRDAKIVASEWQKLANHWLHERWTLQSCGGLRRRAG
ncbi:MAG TPA: YdcF family protein [Candidatus Eisenbacteria bacterium]|nr:YdcF family protein [Candidatus Eisenbacteria bacterium]